MIIIIASLLLERDFIFGGEIILSRRILYEVRIELIGLGTYMRGHVYQRGNAFSLLFFLSTSFPPSFPFCLPRFYGWLPLFIIVISNAIIHYYIHSLSCPLFVVVILVLENTRYVVNVHLCRKNVIFPLSEKR